MSDRLDGVRILIVDDDQDVLEALESFEAPSTGKDNGVKAGATVGAPRTGGKSSDS